MKRPSGSYADDLWWRRIDASYGEIDMLRGRLQVMRGGWVRRFLSSLGWLSPRAVEKVIEAELAALADEVDEMKEDYRRELAKGWVPGPARGGGRPGQSPLLPI